MFGLKPDIKDMTGKYTEYGQSTLTADGILIPVEQAGFEAIVNEIQELKRRVSELESKLQGDL